MMTALAFGSRGGSFTFTRSARREGSRGVGDRPKGRGNDRTSPAAAHHVVVVDTRSNVGVRPLKNGRTVSVNAEIQRNLRTRTRRRFPFYSFSFSPLPRSTRYREDPCRSDSKIK